MHQITAQHTLEKNGKQYIIYSTLYEHGRYASMHECTGLTLEQARTKFIVEHSHEVDRLLLEKRYQKLTQEQIHLTQQN